MRISDWSSDVCSSDLGRGAAAIAAGPDQAPSRRRRTGLAGFHRHRPVERRGGADHPRIQPSAAGLGLRAHPARYARSLRPGDTGRHHHRDTGHSLGELRFDQRNPADPRSRSRRRIRLDRHDRESLRTATDGDLRMSAAILDWSLVLAPVLLDLAMAFAAFRLLMGPRAQDRVLGLDTVYVNGMLLLLLFGIRSGSTAYFEAALIIALLGFVGTVALAKFLMRGEVIE